MPDLQFEGRFLVVHVRLPHSVLPAASYYSCLKDSGLPKLGLIGGDFLSVKPPREVAFRNFTKWKLEIIEF